MTSATLSHSGDAPQSLLPDVDLLHVESLLDPAERERLAVIKEHLQAHVRKQSIDRGTVSTCRPSCCPRSRNWDSANCSWTVRRGCSRASCTLRSPVRTSHCPP